MTNSPSASPTNYPTYSPGSEQAAIVLILTVITVLFILFTSVLCACFHSGKSYREAYILKTRALKRKVELIYDSDKLTTEEKINKIEKCYQEFYNLKAHQNLSNDVVDGFIGPLLETKEAGEFEEWISHTTAGRTSLLVQEDLLDFFNLFLVFLLNNLVSNLITEVVQSWIYPYNLYSMCIACVLAIKISMTIYRAVQHQVFGLYQDVIPTDSLTKSQREYTQFADSADEIKE